ncbi:MAG: polyphosphate kinase 1 [Betaproteobacteria bacterium]|nr:polyphosphate kinase 1 [Betaproteobacteria bacterium]
MKTILLLRHAKAESRHSAKPDFERKLNQRGRADAVALGEMLANRNQHADLLISSSAARCRQTAKIVARALGIKAANQKFSKQLYDVSPDKWLARLHKLPESVKTVLLVGHNPDCEELVKLLTGASAGMRTCALATITHTGSWKNIAAGDFTLANTLLPNKPAAAAAAVAPQNRELSWMAFNERVLQEAENDAVLPLDRLMFLSIVSSNLDEFYRVRVGALDHAIAQHAGEPDRQKSLTMLSEAVHHRAVALQSKIEQTFKIILRLLARRHRLALIVEADMTKQEREFCRAYCADRVRPNMTILTNLDSKTTAGAIATDAIYLAVSMRSPGKKLARALIKIPRSVPRFIELPRPNKRAGVRVAWLDDVIRVSLPDIFSEFGYERFEAHTIKVTRSATIDTDQEILSNYVDSFSDQLKKRDHGKFVRVIHDDNMPRSTLQTLLKNLPLAKHCNVIAAGRYHNLKHLSKFPHPPGNKRLAGSRHAPVPHYNLSRADSLLKTVESSDQLLHFPYHSFTWLLKILRAASIDPKVEGISMSIYRLAPNSQIASALLNAKHNGKKVVVVMELKARFDEEHNIRWARLFEEAGIQVNYGLTGYKTHAKLILIRRSGTSPDLAMIGTGNFNERTAGVYGDMCLITANPKITSEVRKAFGLLLDPARIPNFHQLLVAPRDMRDQIIALINAEAKHAEAGKPARIRLKLNNLVDPILVHHLEHAARAGVQIDLVIRGICAINPDLPDFAGRIRAISIIDGLLEHARILIFENDGDPKAYIGSADFMQRNFNRRVEVYTPIVDAKLRSELIDIFDLQMADNVKARILNAAQDNRRVEHKGKPAVRSQAAIMAYYQKLSKKH